jgi:MFS transporter, DHA2 family, multidrug resistance protein
MFAQAADGLGLSAVAAGFALVPLSVALFAFARAAPRLVGAINQRVAIMAASLVLGLGCAIGWISLARAGFPILLLGLFLIGAGIAVPYASAPRIALAALSQTQTGKGSGIVNSCSFLGGTVGVTCGGIVFEFAGFTGVLGLLGLSALVSAGLCLRLRSA